LFPLAFCFFDFLEVLGYFWSMDDQYYRKTNGLRFLFKLVMAAAYKIAGTDGTDKLLFCENICLSSYDTIQTAIVGLWK
jgi:hypothetical protein